MGAILPSLRQQHPSKQVDGGDVDTPASPSSPVSSTTSSSKARTTTALVTPPSAAAAATQEGKTRIAAAVPVTPESAPNTTTTPTSHNNNHVSASPTTPSTASSSQDTSPLRRPLSTGKSTHGLDASSSHQESSRDDEGERNLDIALEYSAQACACLEDDDLRGALSWYQRALVVYQTAETETTTTTTHNNNNSNDDDEEIEFGLSIVDTCNAAATLHNMGAVYTALNQADAALQSYYDAEQLYRQCQERLESVLDHYYLSLHPDEHADDKKNLHNNNNNKDLKDGLMVMTVDAKSASVQLASKETVCLQSLIAETLHHRATIYESSVWDSVSALECHEACVELLNDKSSRTTSTATANGDASSNNNPIRKNSSDIEKSSIDGNGKDDNKNKTETARVICFDDVYFQHDCWAEDRLQWLTDSYQALAKMYRASDTPRDGLEAILSWQEFLQQHWDSSSTMGTAQDEKEKWSLSLAESYKQLSEYYFEQNEMSDGVDALHKAMELQLQIEQQKTKGTLAAGTKKQQQLEAPPSPRSSRSLDAAAVLSHDLLQQINSIGVDQEETGNYDQALACYDCLLYTSPSPRD